MQLDKTKVKQSFAAAFSTYDSFAVLQRTVGKELLQTVHAGQIVGTVMDVGCGTGFLTQELLRLAAPAELSVMLALDIALPMLQTTRNKLPHENLVAICADAENLPLMAHSINSLFSNLALQWCRNLDAVFAEFKRVLMPDGLLVFSIFGPETLQELKTAWATVDDYDHVNDFYNREQLGNFLQQAGFAVLNIDSKVHVSRYDSVWALMHELKRIGAHNVLAGRNKQITGKTTMQNMIAAYQQQSLNGQILATFEVISVVARIRAIT